MRRKLTYFTPGEWALWGISAAAIVLSFVLFRSDSWLTLCASLVGITSLLFNAKGNPIGQALMLVFGVLYAIISWTFRYYGEMMTYLGMTAPMALAALISWRGFTSCWRRCTPPIWCPAPCPSPPAFWRRI